MENWSNQNFEKYYSSIQGPVIPLYKFKATNELPFTSSMIHPADLVNSLVT